jgi:Flp pilus assembly protein TadB
VFVPGYYAPMTSTWIGYVMLAFAGFMILIGNLIIQRMTSLEA